MSNLTQRILVAIVAIPLIVLISMAGGIYFFAFTSLCSAVALSEFYSLARVKGARPLVVLGIAAGFFVNLSFYHAKLQPAVVGAATSLGWAIPFPSQSQLLVITLLVTVAVLGLVELFRNNGSPLLNLSATLLGILYISLFFGTLTGIRELFVPMDFPVLRYLPDTPSVFDPRTADTVYRWGGYTVISIFSVIWICDTAAFHAGKVMGKHLLFPRVSPKKTWEGAVFGFVFALLSSILAKVLVLPYLPFSGAIAIGVIVGVFGQLGDLVESLLKRDAGVKDSSSLIPGHGGAFDRFDSLLFVAPLVYLYLDFILFS
jgi:phosphatidate cytidylyltransferase